MSIKKGEKESLSELSSLTKNDEDRPTLKAFFLIEIFKWGGLLIALFALISVARPIWEPVYDFFAEVIFGSIEEP